MATNPQRPAAIPENAWRVMQWMRSGDEMFVTTEGEAFVGLADVPIEAVEFLWGNGLLVKLDESEDGYHCRLTDEAWAVAAGDEKFATK